VGDALCHAAKKASPTSGLLQWSVCGRRIRVPGSTVAPKGTLSASGSLYTTGSG